MGPEDGALEGRLEKGGRGGSFGIALGIEGGTAGEPVTSGILNFDFIIIIPSFFSRRPPSLTVSLSLST